MSVAFLSDFGFSEYPGVVKGVIASINSEVRVIDLTHAVRPGEIIQGAWLLFSSYRYFPAKTIFLAIVDPGVGSSRQPLAIESSSYFFIGPDNGLLVPAAAADGIVRVFSLDHTMPPYPFKKISSTFHARDLFAPAAALLAGGIRLESLGRETEIKKELSLEMSPGRGIVVNIDSFGNIVTTALFPQELKGSKNARKIRVVLFGKGFSTSPGRNVSGELSLRVFSTYEEAPDDELFLIEGSSGTVEISRKRASAASLLNVDIGDRIEFL